MNAFLEHALGSAGGDTTFSPESYLTVGSGTFDTGGGVLANFLTVTYRHNLAADDAVIEAQVSRELINWTTIGTICVSQTPNGDGTETVVLRSTTPIATIPREFIRLRVTSRP
jgi:hypothetical protein